MTLVKGLALGYSSDLQQDKPPAWRAFDTTRATVSILRAQARTLRLNADRAEVNCWDSFSTATELANHLVRAAGWSFRDAYRLVGELVKDLSKHRQTLADAPAVLDRLAAAGVSLTTPELADIVNPRRVLARQVSAGGTGPTALAKTIRVLRGEVAELQADVSARDAAGRAALKELHRIAIQFSGGRDLHFLLGPAQKP